MLLQIFAACPAPAAPQCTAFLPMAESRGCAAANSAAPPPAMKVRLAACAPTTPPETGASRDRWPAATAASCAARASATSMVEQSTNRVPGRAAASSPSSRYRARTCLPAGSMVITTSASAAADAADPAGSTPVAAAAPRSSGTRSKPRTR